MKVPRTNQLGVRIKDGLYYKFTGFRDQVSIHRISNYHLISYLFGEVILNYVIVFFSFVVKWYIFILEFIASNTIFHIGP